MVEGACIHTQLCPTSSLCSCTCPQLTLTGSSDPPLPPAQDGEWRGGGQPSECFTAKRNGSFWWTSSVELEACFLRMRMRPKNTEPALYSLPICFSLWSHLFLYLYESTFPSSPRDSPFQQCVRVRAIIPVGGFRGKRGVFSLSFLISCLRHWLMHSRAGVKGPANSQTKGLGSRKKLLKKKL